MLSNAGFEVSTATVDVSSRESVHALVQTATACGDITGVIHAAGVSPSQAPPATILAVDLYGTALVLEEFGNVIASQSGHRLGALTAEQDAALATTLTEELLGLPMLAPVGAGRWPSSTTNTPQPTNVRIRTRWWRQASGSDPRATYEQSRCSADDHARPLDLRSTPTRKSVLR